jgi:tRNA(Ile)-lysidine synthase
MEKVYEMVNRIRGYCRQKELLTQGDRVVIGLSGGADSVCLFLVLTELAKEWELTLVPVHVNHNLRGEEAFSDQKFCEELCRRHNMELIVDSVEVAELAKERGWTLEEAGRNARYKAFTRIKEQYGCHKIAVAHHKNDQAETVLFHLFRGSRMKGLSGMEAKNEAIIRPLLCVSRAEIETYLEEKKQDYCIDHTNLEEEYTRNLIRNRIVPLAQKLQPKVVEHVAETAEYLGQVEMLLERLTSELYEHCVEHRSAGISLRIELLQNADRILAERVIYEALCRMYGRKKDITAGLVTDCMELMKKQTGRYLTLPEGMLVKKQYGELWISRECVAVERHREEILTFPIRKKLPFGAGILSLRLENTADWGEKKLEKLHSIPKSTCTKWFDYDKIEKVVSLKTPEAEDIISLYVDGRGKRVLDVLKEAKVPKEERERLWVLAAGKQVLWIPGIRGSEAYHVSEETKYVLIANIDGGNENGT